MQGVPYSGSASQWFMFWQNLVPLPGLGHSQFLIWIVRSIGCEGERQTKTEREREREGGGEREREKERERERERSLDFENKDRERDDGSTI